MTTSPLEKEVIDIFVTSHVQRLQPGLELIKPDWKSFHSLSYAGCVIETKYGENDGPPRHSHCHFLTLTFKIKYYKYCLQEIRSWSGTALYWQGNLTRMFSRSSLKRQMARWNLSSNRKYPDVDIHSFTCLRFCVVKLGNVTVPQRHSGVGRYVVTFRLLRTKFITLQAIGNQCAAEHPAFHAF